MLFFAGCAQVVVTDGPIDLPTSRPTDPPADPPTGAPPPSVCGVPDTYVATIDVPASVRLGPSLQSRLIDDRIELWADLPWPGDHDLVLSLPDGILFSLQCGDGLAATVNLEAFDTSGAGWSLTGEGTDLHVQADQPGVIEAQLQATVLPTRVSSLCSGFEEGVPRPLFVDVRLVVGDPAERELHVPDFCPKVLTGVPMDSDVLWRTGSLVGVPAHRWSAGPGLNLCLDTKLHFDGSGSLQLELDGETFLLDVVERGAIDEVDWIVTDRLNPGSEVVSQVLGGQVGIQEQRAQGVRVCGADVDAYEVRSTTLEACNTAPPLPSTGPIDPFFGGEQPLPVAFRLPQYISPIVPGEPCGVELSAADFNAGAGWTGQRSVETR